jgi:2-amino-4-hydroxy-6-hydroxymethyldihydropteridine diphosphokinase
MSISRIFRWNPQAHCIYISLGSNIRPEQNLPRAMRMLNKFGQVVASSSIWETVPVGTVGPSFLNAVVLLQANYPHTILKSLVLRRIEIEMGRIRTLNKFAPRPIDLDILIADGQIIESGIWYRAHLAVPLAELLPDLHHPQWGKRLGMIAQELNQPDMIHARPDIKLD